MGLLSISSCLGPRHGISHPNPELTPPQTNHPAQLLLCGRSKEPIYLQGHLEPSSVLVLKPIDPARP